VGAARIQDYGVIGNGRSAALVSKGGSIDWLCWPRFDSPSLFAALLDADKGGHFRIAPVAPFAAHHAYAPDSNALVTEHETAGGTLRLTDFMPVYSEEDKRHLLFPEHEILRIVECVRGEVEAEVAFAPRPDYARKMVQVRSAGRMGLRIQDGRSLFSLRADLDLRAGAAATRFRLRAGERAHFSLTFDSDAPAVFPPLGDPSSEALARTIAWWQGWVARCRYDGPHRDAVTRSLLALKLLSYAPSGAIVAAPTSSLPEKIGGDLNWDYRYCWLRDASMTVRVFRGLGYEDEADAFVSWLLYSTRLHRRELKVLYNVHGEIPPPEQELPDLAGHAGSRPVRIGNAAMSQLQLDGYGEVVEAVAHLSRAQSEAKLDRETQSMLRQFGEYVCRNWNRPDQGIWEPRETPKHHTHSRVLCWVALDRLLALHARGHLLRIPADVFERNRALIREDIEAHAWNERLSSYTQVLGGDTVDAALLRMSWSGFKPASDPRMRGTHALIVERLRAGPGLLYRYEESRPAGEGAFGICTPWEIEYLAAGGASLEEAENGFDRMLGYANDLGLYAEEIDPATGEALGNFPQAYTHVGLISAALAIEERRRGPEAAQAAMT
jgi:GH15 family glucan-1,4-alpha-glucosidase